LGEANFSDHGANRLGASALMQGLADGYFVIPYTLGDYLAGEKQEKISTDHAAFKQAESEVSERIKRLLAINGTKTVDEIHRALGKVVWDECGMARSAEGLKGAIEQVRKLRDEFWTNVRVLGTGEEVNQSLEKALRLADFLELAELMCVDALDRNESCGCHLRTEYQTPEGEARRNDDDFCYVAAWGYEGEGKAPSLTKENLVFENIKLVQRSYK
jgi:succinate dehydrogenase / fumarate reductase flavoprotein subunit